MCSNEQGYYQSIAVEPERTGWTPKGDAELTELRAKVAKLENEVTRREQYQSDAEQLSSLASTQTHF